MKKIKTVLADLVIKHPAKIIIFLTIIVILAASTLPKLKNDPNPWLLNKSHPARVALFDLRESYTGSGDSIFILLEAKNTIFNSESLKRIKQLTDAFTGMMLITEKDLSDLKIFGETLNGHSAVLMEDILANGLDKDSWESFIELEDSLKSSDQWSEKTEFLINNIIAKLSPVTDVTSLSNTDNISASVDGIEISPVYEEIPETISEVELIKKKVTGNRLFKDILFTDDLKYTSIIIEQNIKDNDSLNQYLLYEKVKTILEKEIPGQETHYISGMPVASATLGHTMQVDSSRLFPIVLGLVVICLFLSFRMIMGIVAPLIVVIFSLILTLALKVFFDVPINIITTTLPVFILSIGVADGIHIFSEFRDNILEGMKKTDAIRKTIDELTAPVVMTSITTATAFWALSLTEIVQLKHFGLFIAAGTLIAMLFSLVFIPALILLLPGVGRQKTEKTEPVIDKYVSEFLDKTSKFAIEKPYHVFLITLIIVAVSIYGTTKVVVDNNNVKYQLDDSPLVISTEKINEKAAGSSVLNILVKSNTKDVEPFTNPVNLKAVADLSSFIEERNEVGKVTGLSELIKRINFVLNEENPEFDRLPALVERTSDGREINGQNLVSQLLLLYENGGGDVLSDVVLSDYSAINIPVILKVNSSLVIKELIEDISNKAETILPDNLSFTVSGSASTMVSATSEIVKGQITSLGISFLLIFILLIYTFRSVIIGITAMLPLLSTIIFNFGIMGFFKIPLDIGTAVISSIVIGIGVDYSIHYLKRMKEYSNNGYDFNEAISKTVMHSGKAILSNAFTVGTGFTAMLFSILTPLTTMGWMITVTMFISAVSTIILLPSVLSVVSKYKGKSVVSTQTTTPAYT